MTGATSRIFSACCLLWLALVLASPAAAQDYQVETFRAPPPEELAAIVRESLPSEAIGVRGPDRPLCEIWLRKAIPANTGAALNLGTAYPQLVEASLVGAIRFAAAVRVYRRQSIKPGVYTFRYALHPADGNHMGVAPQRDFLLLVPAAEDHTAEAKSFDELVILSRAATGSAHPSVWSLTEPEDNPTSLPSLMHREEENFWLLYLNAQVATGGASPEKLLLVLVVVGHAPEA